MDGYYTIPDTLKNESARKKGRSARWYCWLTLSLWTIMLLTLGQMFGSFLMEPYSFPDPEVDDLTANAIATGAMYASFIGIWMVFLAVMLLWKKNRPLFRHLWTGAEGNTLRFAAIGTLMGFGLNGLCALCARLNGDIFLYFHDFSLTRFILLFIAVLIQSGAEELSCRLFLYRRLERVYPRPIIPVIINSLLFSFLHLGNPGVTSLAVYNITAVGILTSLFVFYWDSFWAPVFIHTAWNFCQSILLGLPNSGTVVPYSIFRLDAAQAENSLFYDTAFGIEGTVFSDIVLTASVIAVFIIGRKTTGKKIECLPETA